MFRKHYKKFLDLDYYQVQKFGKIYTVSWKVQKSIFTLSLSYTAEEGH